MPKLELTSTERKNLRSAAHGLKPVVMIGDRGLTENALQEINRNLSAHQLIKIRVSGQERAEREQLLDSICESQSCGPVAHLGKILIVYRPQQASHNLVGDDSLPATRALRKSGAPYVPKKQAAEGLSRTRKSLAIQLEIRKATNLKKVAARPRPAEAPQGLGRRAARTGSALSLKAGARRRLRGE